MITTDLAYGSLPEQKLDLYYAGENAPLFIFFHGGGLEHGSKSGGKSQAFTELMNAGISVADANYRMYPRPNSRITWKTVRSVPHGANRT